MHHFYALYKFTYISYVVHNLFIFDWYTFLKSKETILYYKRHLPKDKFFHNSRGAERFRGTPHFIGLFIISGRFSLHKKVLPHGNTFSYFPYCINYITASSVLADSALAASDFAASSFCLAISSCTSSFRESILASRSDTIMAHSTSSFLICSGAFPSNL